MTTAVDETSSSLGQPKVGFTEPFGDALRRSVRPLDVAILLLPAVVLVGVGVLPWELQEQMAFSYTEPTLLTAFTAHFVHANSVHLFQNLAAYLLVVPTVYVLSTLAGRRQLFYIVFVVVLFVFPFVLSGLNLAVPREALSVGSSGLALAFVGYLPVAFAEYVRQRFDVRDTTRRDIAGGLFFIGLLAVIPLAAAAVRPRLSGVLILVALLAVAGYGVSLRRSGVDRSTLRGPPPGYVEFAAWSIVILLVGLITAFPAGPLSDAGLVNIYTHFLGYTLGFLSSYLAVLSFLTPE